MFFGNKVVDQRWLTLLLSVLSFPAFGVRSEFPQQFGAENS
jgi:hypothetical protein